jgi:hypothetical protein
MDGVLADFETGASTALGYSIDFRLIERDSKYRNTFWAEVSRFSKAGGELWSTLPLMPDARVLWSKISPMNPTILTAAGDPNYNATRQKHGWVKRHFGDVPTIVTATSRDKAVHAATNGILIDDREKSIYPWVAAGGIGILHTSAADTIAQLNKIIGD